jgi:hypothetical protein
MGWTEQEFRDAQARLASASVKKLAPEITAASMLMQLSPSTDEKKLNKTEKAFLNVLRSRGLQWIGIQNITLKLADDTRYTPDFFYIHDGKLNANEVKGFFRDDAKVKIKVAARLFPWIRFTLVFKGKGSAWEYREVKP